MMKKLFTLLLTTCLLLSITGCGKVNDNPDILKGPSALTVTALSQSVDTLLGGCSWTYDNGDGTFTSINADSLHPLNSKGYMETLELPGSLDFSKNPPKAVLQFVTKPDEISILRYSDAYWDDVTAEGEYVPVEDFTFSLKEGGYIYEINAVWNSSDKYHGTAQYSFYSVIPAILR